jgi:hypothetical protein
MAQAPSLFHFFTILMLICGCDEMDHVETSVGGAFLTVSRVSQTYGNP